MASRACARSALLALVGLFGLGISFAATAGPILDCGSGGANCSIGISIDGVQVGQGSYDIDSTTGAISLSGPSGGALGDSNAVVNSVYGNADPILGFGIGASTGALGNAFSITMTLPIAITGQIIANSSINYSLTALSGAGAQISPLFGNVLIAREVDTSIGGLSPLNKGVDAGGTFFFLGGPATNPSPVYTASNTFTGSLQYDLMSVTLAFSLSANSSVDMSGFVQQVESVPEPAAVLLLALGFGALVWRRLV